MELNKIYKTDCISLLKQTPDNYIHLTVTSPPYNLGEKHHTGNNKFKAYDEYIDYMPEQEYQQQRTHCANEHT